MKYRYLTFSELSVMQDDFTKYLHQMGFSRFDWRVLQDQHSEQAVNILGQYSDKTFQKVMESVQYLEYRSRNELHTYSCSPKQLVLIGIKAPKNSCIDFTNKNSLQGLKKDKLLGYKCFKQIIPYKVERPRVVFNLIEKGHYVSDETNFKYLERLRQAYQN